MIAEKEIIARVRGGRQAGDFGGNKNSGLGFKESNLSADTWVFGAAVQKSLCLWC